MACLLSFVLSALFECGLILRRVLSGPFIPHRSLELTKAVVNMMKQLDRPFLSERCRRSSMRMFVRVDPRGYVWSKS